MNLIVEYVGLKPQETDHMAGTGLTWVGKGSTQVVPAEAWDVMKNHPDVWALVGEAEDEPGLADAQSRLEELEAKNEALRAEIAQLREQANIGKGDPAANVDLDAMDADALKAFAAERGIALDGRLKSADAIRKAIRAA